MMMVNALRPFSVSWAFVMEWMEKPFGDTIYFSTNMKWLGKACVFYTIRCFFSFFAFASSFSLSFVLTGINR